MAKSTIIATLHADTEPKCMVNCVRRYPCMAYNYHAEEKTCILMAEMWCMAPSSLNHTSYLFAHLHPCKLQTVWYSVRPADHNWYWVTTDDPRNNADIIKLPGYDARYVSRTLYQGYYLPGWWRPNELNKFRSVDPVTPEVTRCLYEEFLAFTKSSSYWWTSYVIGYTLPDDASPVSQLPDGIPLYLVRYQYSHWAGISEKVSGFYNHFTKSTYVLHSGVFNPTIVDILCGTGI